MLDNLRTKKALFYHIFCMNLYFYPLFKDELKEAMEMIGEPVSDEDIDNMITMADLNKDGKIDYEGMYESVFLPN